MSQRKESDIYNVSTYSDGQLYDILDVSNPSDRELEAKIIYLYRKYKNMQNSSGDQLAKFFYDIHKHFFDDDNNEEYEKENNNEENSDEENDTKEGMTTLLDALKEQSADIDTTNSRKSKLQSNINTVDLGNVQLSNTIDTSYYSNNNGNTTERY
jgi:hypothetical protein